MALLSPYARPPSQEYGWRDPVRCCLAHWGKATSWAAVAEQGWGGKGDLHTRWGLTPPQKSTTELGPQGTSEQSSLLRTSPFSEFPSIQEARSELQGPATYPPLHPMIPCHILMSNCLRQFTFDLSLCPLPYTVGA